MPRRCPQGESVVHVCVAALQHRWMLAWRRGANELGKTRHAGRAIRVLNPLFPFSAPCCVHRAMQLDALFLFGGSFEGARLKRLSFPWAPHDENFGPLFRLSLFESSRKMNKAQLVPRPGFGILSPMAGWYRRLNFSASARDPDQIVKSIQAASTRFEHRGVQRLRWPEVHHGNTSAEWESFGVSPVDIGLTEDLLIQVPKATSLDALTLGPWCGVALCFDVPPHAFEPSPTIYGSCTWWLWLGEQWRIACSLEWPSSSDRPSDAWVAAFETFVEAAGLKRVFER